MGAGNPRAKQYDHLDPKQLNPEVNILGRQIWRVVNYAKPYWRRGVAGIGTNALARMADLIPFVAIGWAVDYFANGLNAGPSTIIAKIPLDPAISYGLLIFLSFSMLAVFQGFSEYCWQTLGYKVQHDLRMEATCSLIDMEASYYDSRQTGQLMSVLSADVNQLEDVISDSSTSIIRIVVTFFTAFIILILMQFIIYMDL